MQVICYFTWVTAAHQKKGSYLLLHKSVTIWNHIDIGIYSCKLSKQFENFIKHSKLFFAPHGI